MSEELEYLSREVAVGKLNRRDFLGRAAALGVSTLFANSALTSAVRAAGPQRGGTLKAGLQGGQATDSLDPATWTSATPVNFGHTWGEQLVQLDKNGEPQPALAEEWGASDHATSWTFKIRKNVEFHNGKTLTPDDVVATIERHSDEKSKSSALGIMSGIKSVKADGQNVIFTLREPNADLPYLLDDYHLMIQPNGGKDDPAAGVGTGPYRMAVNEPGVRHVGERFKNYWRDDRGFAETVEIIVVNDATARIAALQSGQVDMIDRIEPKIVDLIKRVPGVTIRNVQGKGHYVFLMHCNTAPFDNRDFRLALKYAIDREEMVQKILLGYGTIGNDTPINATYPFFTDLEQREYDLDKAKFHYKKSGHEASIVLRTSDSAFPGAVDAAQLYQQSAAKAGIKLEIKREPGDGYWSEVWNKQPFCASYWDGRPTQDLMYTSAYYSKASWNDTRFFRDDFDKMLLQARGELDPDKRKQLYHDMGQMVHDEGGLINPVFADFIDATGPRIVGWVDNPNGNMMDFYALAKCWLEA